MEFQTALDGFLQFCAIERRQSEHTLSAYRFDLLDFRKWLPVERRHDDVTEDDLKQYLQNMVSVRSLSMATVRRRLACLRGFFRRQAELGLQKDPFANWRPKLPRSKRLPRALARPEVLSLLRTDNRPAKSDRDFQTALCLMVATGLRVGELCSLRLEDLSPDGTSVRVHGKGSRDRVVYVPDRWLRSELCALAAKRRLKDGNEAPLFLNRLGLQMKPQSIRSKLRSVAAGSGIHRRITPHMLRHTAATLLIETGVDIRFVQRLLGHSSIATTEIYTHVADEALRSTLERADVLGSLHPG